MSCSEFVDVVSGGVQMNVLLRLTENAFFFFIIQIGPLRFFCLTTLYSLHFSIYNSYNYKEFRYFNKAR